MIPRNFGPLKNPVQEGILRFHPYSHQAYMYVTIRVFIWRVRRHSFQKLKRRKLIEKTLFT